jgi:hypothetical protein
MIIFRILAAVGLVIVGFYVYPTYLIIIQQVYAIAQTLYVMPALDTVLFEALPLIGLMVIAYAGIMALTHNWHLR